MEIGPPSSMPNNPEQHTITAYIHLFEDGFSFCSPTKTQFFSEEAYTLTSSDSWEEARQNFGLNSTDHVELVLCNCSAVSIPEAHFDANLLDTYLASSVEKPIGGTPTFDDAQKSSQISTFYIESAVVTPIKKVFPELQAKHLNSRLMEVIEPLSRAQIRKRLYVHLRNGYVEFVLCHGALLWLINRFPQDSPERFLYYLFYIVEQFELEPDQFEIVFLGRFTSFEEYYQGAMDYHQEVTWIPVDHGLVGLESHPAPFLASYRP